MPHWPHCNVKEGQTPKQVFGEVGGRALTAGCAGRKSGGLLGAAPRGVTGYVGIKTHQTPIHPPTHTHTVLLGDERAEKRKDLKK